MRRKSMSLVFMITRLLGARRLPGSAAQPAPRPGLVATGAPAAPGVACDPAARQWRHYALLSAIEDYLKDHVRGVDGPVPGHHDLPDEDPPPTGGIPSTPKPNRPGGGLGCALLGGRLVNPLCLGWS